MARDKRSMRRISRRMGISHRMPNRETVPTSTQLSKLPKVCSSLRKVGIFFYCYNFLFFLSSEIPVDDNDVEIAFDDTDSDVDEADDDDEEANGWRMYMRQRNPEPDVDAYSSVDEEEEDEGDEDRETFDTQLPTRHSVRST